MSNLYFLIISFIYLTLVMIIYFRKEKIDTKENKLFSKLIIVSLIGIILDFCSVYMAFNNLHGPLFRIINQLYLVYLLTWISLITIYSITISSKNKQNNKLINIIKGIYIPASIFMLIYPLSYTVTDNEFYTHGLSASIMYILSTVYVVIMLIILIKDFKNIKQKKYTPILFYIFIGTFITLIQATNPSILIITSMECFVTILMFFTIENPDMKLIKELNVAKDRADKANQAKTEFLSSMSHEIRTPLNAIVGFSQALKEEELPKEALEEVDDIIMASNSLLEIINGILDISKIESGKIEIVNKEYRFKEIFDELVILSKGRLGDKALDFKYSYDDSIPAVLYGDYTRVKQVILNILTNAIKYTKEGYVDFKVSSVIKDDICRIIVSVEDSGIGIKQENISKLFSKFERFDLDKNITIEGTGLGLAITKKLVELMGGRIVVQSVYGKGSKFTIAIDQKIIATEVEESDEEQIEEKEIDVSGKKVLIVDDNKINLKVASRLLQNYKVITEEVDSGFSCIDKITAGEKYDIILMDDMMPKMSGVETLKKLKEIDGFNIPVIALTANAIAGMKEKYISEGFTDYLAKPIDKGELNNIISKYLNK